MQGFVVFFSQATKINIECKISKFCLDIFFPCRTNDYLVLSCLWVLLCHWFHSQKGDGGIWSECKRQPVFSSWSKLLESGEVKEEAVRYFKQAFWSWLSSLVILGWAHAFSGVITDLRYEGDCCYTLSTSCLKDYCGDLLFWGKRKKIIIFANKVCGIPWWVWHCAGYPGIRCWEKYLTCAVWVTESDSSVSWGSVSLWEKNGKLRKVVSIGSINASFVQCLECYEVVAWASLRASCLSKPPASAGNTAVSEMSLFWSHVNFCTPVCAVFEARSISSLCICL